MDQKVYKDWALKFFDNSTHDVLQKLANPNIVGQMMTTTVLNNKDIFAIPKQNISFQAN
jgi:hypothetical protein